MAYGFTGASKCSRPYAAVCRVAANSALQEKELINTIASPWALLQRALNNYEARVVTVFSGLQLLLGLVGNRLLTGAVPPELLGKYYLYTNILLWLSLPSTSLYVYFMRHWSVARQHGVPGLLARRMAWVAAVQALLGLCGGLLAAWSGKAGWWAVPFLTLIPAAVAIQQLLGQVPALERRRVMAGWLSLASVSRPWFLAAAALLPSLSLPMLLALHLVCSAAEVVLTLALLKWVLREIPLAAPSATCSRDLEPLSMLHFAFPYFITAIVTQCAGSAERWGLAAKADTAATALFVQAVGLAAAAVGAVMLPLRGYFHPIISELSGRTDAPLRSTAVVLRRYMFTAVLSLSTLVLAVAMAAQPLTSVLLGARYQTAALLLPLTIVGAALFGLGQALAMVPFAARNAWGPNGALWCSNAFYIFALLSVPSDDRMLWRYCMLFIASNIVYAIFMCGIVIWHYRRAANSPSVSGAAGP